MTRPLASKLGDGEIWAMESKSEPGTARMIAVIGEAYYCSCPARLTCRHIETVKRRRIKEKKQAFDRIIEHERSLSRIVSDSLPDAKPGDA